MVSEAMAQSGHYKREENKSGQTKEEECTQSGDPAWPLLELHGMDNCVIGMANWGTRPT